MPPSRPRLFSFRDGSRRSHQKVFTVFFFASVLPAKASRSLIPKTDLAPFVSEYGVQVVKMFTSQKTRRFVMNEFDNGPIHVEENGRFAAIPDDSIAMKCRVDRPYFYTDGSTVASSVSIGYNTYASSATEMKLWMFIGNGQRVKSHFRKGHYRKVGRAKVDSGTRINSFVRERPKRSKDALDPASVGLKGHSSAEVLFLGA